MQSLRMQSLRTRKPAQGTKAQRQPARLAKPSNKDARQSRVDDKIKKRMSMRYADISSPTSASIPPVPVLPLSEIGAVREQGGVRRDRQGIREDPKETDKRLLDDANFDPDAYLNTKLANSTESEIKSLQSSLLSFKDETTAELQDSVFENYSEFVQISKEISTLENEMLELKENLADWKGMPSLLHVEESTSVVERRRNVRSSIADLRILYANQMQTLHAQIEGSAKFAPTTPGRHVVAEVDGILALNPATYKVNHTVRFVVLDDAVLVARVRRRRNNAESAKLVAEKCWPLNEMLVLDTKDTANMTNVFKIRHSKETHVYRTEQAAEKKNLLAQFRSVAEELADRRRKEREGEYERRKTLFIGDTTSSSQQPPPLPEWMADLSRKGAEMNSSSAKERNERDARWVGEFADELTVAISLRQWDEAVTMVEEGKTKLATVPSLAAKLTPLTTSLTTSLLNCLSSADNHKSAVVHLISLLERLNAAAAARSAFLAARTQAIRRLVRAIRFEGHTGMYINDLAIVIFTGIKHTADWFLASFKENEVSSRFVDWAKSEMEYYGQIFRKQVYGSDVDAKVTDEAVRITYQQSKKLLQEYGLDFRFLLEHLLVQNPTDRLLPETHFRPHSIPKPLEFTPTPVPTPLRRSPAPPESSRPRTPRPAPPSPAPVRLSVASPAPLRPRSPGEPTTPTGPTMSLSSRSPLAGADRPPRSLRGSPAPPPPPVDPTRALYLERIARPTSAF